MSTRRNADMAAIQAAIETGIRRKQDKMPLRDQIGVDLLSRGESADDEAIDATIKDVDAQQAEQDTAEKDALDAATADQALQLKQRSLLKAQFRKTVQTSGRALSSVQNGIGRIPMPTGIWLPLVVLLILSMLLIKVNGNTRWGWLWLVISGNAALPDSQVSTAASGTITTVTNANGSLTGSGDFGPGIAKGGGAPVSMHIPTGYYPLEMDEW